MIRNISLILASVLLFAGCASTPPPCPSVFLLENASAHSQYEKGVLLYDLHLENARTLSCSQGGKSQELWVQLEAVFISGNPQNRPKTAKIQSPSIFIAPVKGDGVLGEPQIVRFRKSQLDLKKPSDLFRQSYAISIPPLKDPQSYILVGFAISKKEWEENSDWEAKRLISRQRDARKREQNLESSKNSRKTLTPCQGDLSCGLRESVP